MEEEELKKKRRERDKMRMSELKRDKRQRTGDSD